MMLKYTVWIAVLFGLGHCCGAATEHPFLGSWTGDLTEMVLKQPATTPEMRAAFEKMPEDQRPTIFISYNVDGKFKGLMQMNSRRSEFSGTWTLIEQAEGWVKIRAVGSQGNRVSEITFEIQGPDLLLMTNPAMPGKVLLKRQTENEAKK